MKQEYTAQLLGTDESFKLELNSSEYHVNGKAMNLDVIRVQDRMMHIIKDNQSFNCELIEMNAEEKILKIKVNGRPAEIKIQDKFDLLLKDLGMSDMLSNKVNDLKAPMPGLVLKVLVAEGAEVKKGDTLLVLEAMKMENNIKATHDVNIKQILIKPGDKVEKNQTLIAFQ
jgi:biotin carboxyl carrier protein